MSMCLWNTGVKSNHSKTYVAIELIRRRDSILRVYTHNISLLAYSINYIFDLLAYLVLTLLPIVMIRMNIVQLKESNIGT